VVLQVYLVRTDDGKPTYVCTAQQRWRGRLRGGNNDWRLERLCTLCVFLFDYVSELAFVPARLSRPAVVCSGRRAGRVITVAIMSSSTDANTNRHYLFCCDDDRHASLVPPYSCARLHSRTRPSACGNDGPREVAVSIDMADLAHTGRYRSSHQAIETSNQPVWSERTPFRVDIRAQHRSE
jgi:hypothetical protein